MVVTCLRNKKTRAVGIPVINLNELDKPQLCERLVKACEDYGFFMVENHGVSRQTIFNIQKEAQHFFSKPAFQKNQAGPPTPFGYGSKNIGYNGDKGDLEYLLMEANPLTVSQRSNTISTDPQNFR